VLCCWPQVDVVEKIDEMGETVNQYQAQCKKLPKALREWQAFIDCRKTIDDFLEMLPLFQVCCRSGRVGQGGTRSPQEPCIENHNLLY
jgi:hypothetical protein